MIINWDTKLYCLIGNPVNGSLSPIIHNYINKMDNINSRYMTFNVQNNSLSDVIKGFLALGLKGFNITSPYKETIIPYLDEIVGDSEKIGAINTVKNENGKLIGINTDGAGFIKMFYDNNISLKDKKILILGAGGAAKGICYSLIREELSQLVIINRTKDKATKLARQLKKINTKLNIQSKQLEDIKNRKEFDVLINTTTVGMKPNNKKSPITLEGFKESLVVCDIIYKPLETQLLREAKMKGFEYYNGIPMLINQAILAQEFWLDKRLSDNVSVETIKYINEYLKED